MSSLGKNASKWLQTLINLCEVCLRLCLFQSWHKQIVQHSVEKSHLSMLFCSRATKGHSYFNHNYNKILKSDWLSYTCQLFLRYKREIFILGVLGFLQTTRSFPKIPKEVRSLPKTSEVCRRRSYRENAYPQNQRS